MPLLPIPPIIVRGGNGCMPGNWSNIVSAKTQRTNTYQVAHFFPTSKSIIAPSQTALVNSASNCQNIYTVQPGNSLWMIAQKLFNNGARFVDLISQNIDRYTSLHISTIIHPNSTLNYRCK